MSWTVRLILALQRRKYGAELEPSRLWGRVPRALLFLTLLYRSRDRSGSPVEPGLRALVQVCVSQINWCAFCVDLNAAAALERHVLPETLAYAQAATDPRKPVDDACRARLRAHFDQQAIVELTGLIAFQNMSSKFNAALGVPAQGFCKHGDSHEHRQST